jgi:hypothetical protein
MKIAIAAVILFLFASACQEKEHSLPIAGTWQLITGTLIEKGDTSVTDYTKGKKFIKIINDSHFAFLNHDLSKGRDSLAAFSAGGGTYSLRGNQYTENLEFCSDRQWEQNSFPFTVTIHNDTLIQEGREKVEGTSIDRLNIEKYKRVAN